MKFKTGDKVVVVKPDGMAGDKYIGEAFTIIEDRLPLPHCYRLDCTFPFRWRDSELELEAVVNSPLYQALR